MKQPKFNICLALCASLLTSMSIGAATPDSTPMSLDLTTDQLKVSYSIGVKSAEDLKQYNLDTQAYLAGYRDTAMGTTLKLSEQEMNAAISKLQQELSAKRDAEKKAMDQKMKEAATSNLTAGTKFLDNNKTQPGVQVTASGLQYKILTAGTGAKAKLGDNITVHYKGSTIDGKEFDSSYKRKSSATFKLEKGGLIEGWIEALQLMPVGSTWQITVPSALGYGEHGIPSVIEPNAVLIFEIELIATKS